MRANRKTHFSIQEKADILVDNTSLLYKEAEVLAKYLDIMPFQQIQAVIKALQIIKKGK